MAQTIQDPYAKAAEKNPADRYEVRRREGNRGNISEVNVDDIPPRIKGYERKDAVSLVIGISKYREGKRPAVKYAVRDSEARTSTGRSTACLPIIIEGHEGRGGYKKDRFVELGDLFQYVKANVAEKASLELNRDQTPVLLPSDDKSAGQSKVQVVRTK